MPTNPCEWCGNPAEGRKATCGSAHRGARWRWLQGIGNDAPPWRQSPLHGRKGEASGAKPAPAVVVVDNAELRRAQRDRNAAAGRAERALKRAEEAEAVAARKDGSRQGHRARSGVMLSYAKTRETLFQKLSHFPSGERLIDEALRESLAPAQLRKLEARDAG